MRAAPVATAVAAMLLLLVAGCDPDDQAADTPTPTPTAATPGGEGSTTPSSPDPEPVQDAAVTVQADGRVVVLDPATGEEVRELLADVAVGDPASNDLAVTPDGSAAFVGVPAEDPDGASEIVRVPVAGGEPETVAQGSMPAISPDGRTLAYVRFEEPADADQPGLPQPVLVLHDLGSDEQTRLTRTQPFHFIPDVAWTADGAQVVFTAGEIYTGLYAIDRDAESLDEARRLGPDVEAEGDTTSWGPVAALGDGRLAVVETCCDVPREERWHVITVGVAEGDDRGSLTPADRLEVTHLDEDAAAERLLMVVAGGPEGGSLLRWDGSGEPEPIAEGVIAAAW